MTDYGTMIGRINDELAIPAVAARIPNAIQAALRFYESERFWFTEGEATASTADSQANYAVPTDLLEPDIMTVTDTNSIRWRLTRRPWNWYRAHQLDSTATSIPRNWSYYGDEFWLYPIPDAVYTLTLSYLKRLTAPTAYTDTSNWFTHGEELIRTRAKWDLLQHSAGDTNAALPMKAAERDALKNLRSKSEQKISTGKLSFDDGLAGADGYNINYE